jgi:DNA mismatch repair ATPase MutL
MLGMEGLTMKKTLFLTVVFVLVLPTFCVAQASMSEASLQQSSQDSLQQSSEDSLQQSSDQTTQESSDQTTQQSTENSSENSSQQTSDESSNASSESSADSSAQLDQASVITLVVGGAVVAVGVTALGVTWLVDVSGATVADAIDFQDQVYAARGADFDRVVRELAIRPEDLVRAHDELVAEGLRIESDEDAADYLAALFLRLST